MSETTDEAAFTLGMEIKALRDDAERDADKITRLRAALEWYGENARLARLIHTEGDEGRHALSEYGGKRARDVLGG